MPQTRTQRCLRYKSILIDNGANCLFKISKNSVFCINIARFIRIKIVIMREINIAMVSRTPALLRSGIIGDETQNFVHR